MKLRLSQPSFNFWNLIFPNSLPQSIEEDHKETASNGTRRDLNWMPGKIHHWKAVRNWNRLPWKCWSPHPWSCCAMGFLGTCSSGGLSSAGLTPGFCSLKALFKATHFCNCMIDVLSTPPRRELCWLHKGISFSKKMCTLWVILLNGPSHKCFGVLGPHVLTLTRQKLLHICGKNQIFFNVLWMAVIYPAPAHRTSYRQSRKTTYANTPNRSNSKIYAKRQSSTYKAVVPWFRWSFSKVFINSWHNCCPVSMYFFGKYQGKENHHFKGPREYPALLELCGYI